MASLKYRLERISVTDFKKIKKADIPLTNSLTIIGGRNGQGKSSAIDALVAAMGGAKLDPEMPVRRGAEVGKVLLDIQSPSGLLRAQVFYQEGEKRELHVGFPDMGPGFKSGQPATLLKELFSAIATDPLAFTREKPRDQVETFKTIFGIDTSALDRERKGLYEERTGRNAVVRDLEGKYRQLEAEPPDTPDEEVSISDLTARLDAISAHNGLGERMREEAERKAARLNDMDEALAGQEARVKELRDQLAREEEKLADWRNKRAEQERAALADQKTAAAYEFKDPEDVRTQLEAADRINAGVRQKRRRVEERQKWEDAKAASESLTARIEEIDRKKAELLKKVELPVDGLTFDDDGLYLNGLPFSQASSAEQLRVAVPLAFAQNTGLKFAIIRDGSLLDEESLRLVAELTEQAGGQLILERVTTDPEQATVIFEDGELVGATEAA